MASAGSAGKTGVTSSRGRQVKRTKLPGEDDAEPRREEEQRVVDDDDDEVHPQGSGSTGQQAHLWQQSTPMDLR